MKIEVKEIKHTDIIKVSNDFFNEGRRIAQRVLGVQNG